VDEYGQEQTEELRKLCLSQCHFVHQKTHTYCREHRSLSLNYLSCGAVSVSQGSVNVRRPTSALGKSVVANNSGHSIAEMLEIVFHCFTLFFFYFTLKLVCEGIRRVAFYVHGLN
jgi:hypothetical protein